ncbi:MAG: hypothetical protein Q4G67_02855 [Actinomycetia bacterium]|nr:hypothetical protein [Actinomycetes bacterium]
MTRPHHNDGDIESRLREMLAAQADEVDVTADFTRPAIARRQRTQRRTMIATGVVAGVALAIAIPVGASLLPQASTPLDPASRSETQMATDPGTAVASTEATGTSTPTTAATAVDTEPETTTGTAVPTDPSSAAAWAPPQADRSFTNEQLAELAPFAIGNTLHLPTGSFSIAEHLVITGLSTLQGYPGMPNGNALIRVHDTTDDTSSFLVIPVGTDSDPLPVGTGELVVAPDGTVFTLAGEDGTVRVIDRGGLEIASADLPDQTVLYVDEETVYSFNSLERPGPINAWNYRTGATAEVDSLPSFTSEDGVFEVTTTYADAVLTETFTNLSTGDSRSEGSPESVFVYNPVAFSADNSVLYSARGIESNGLTRSSDGAWLMPQSIDPAIRSFTLTRDGTALMTVFADEGEDGAGQNVLALCDLGFENCEAVSDVMDLTIVDEVIHLGGIVLAIQH